VAKKKSAASVKFEYAIPFEARIPEFETLASLGALDLARLGKGSHKVEVGFFKGGCCSKLVKANVKNGMVTGIEVEPCKDTRKPPPEMKAVLQEAVRRLIPDRPGKFQPVPIAKFVANARGLIVINGGCIQICWWGSCLTCCWSDDGGFGCTTDPIFIGPLEVAPR
jgi:hypothetical protein